MLHTFRKAGGQYGVRGSGELVEDVVGDVDIIDADDVRVATLVEDAEAQSVIAFLIWVWTWKWCVFIIIIRIVGVSGLVGVNGPDVVHRSDILTQIGLGIAVEVGTECLCAVVIYLTLTVDRKEQCAAIKPPEEHDLPHS